MYIRWKKKARTTKWIHKLGTAGLPAEPDILYVAYLVRSERIDGKPRQEQMYLASIRDTRLIYDTHRLHFWRSVAAKIAPLNLPIEQQRAIKAKLNERVPDV